MVRATPRKTAARAKAPPLRTAESTLYSDAEQNVWIFYHV